jgi:hypothetical protein
MHFRSGEALSEPSRDQGAPPISKDAVHRQPLTRFSREILQKDSGGPSLENKDCRKCHRTKSVSEFPRNPRVSDGYSSWCKACHAAACRQTRARQREAARERHWKRQQENIRRLREQAR